MIGSFFGKLFGADKALTSVVDGVSSGLDKLVYTDEEKAEDAAKATTEARRMVVEWMKSTQGQNLARRLIALSVVATWLSMYIFGVIVSMVAVFVNNSGAVTAEKLIKVSDIAKASAVNMNPAVMLVMAFYFAAPHMGGIVQAALGKMSKTPERVG